MTLQITHPAPVQEPVAWVTGLHAGRCVIKTINPAAILPVGIALYTTPPAQRTEPPAWFPAVENILNEYGLQAIDFAADFKAAMKDAERSQRTWVGSGDLEDSNAYQTPPAERQWVGLTDDEMWQEWNARGDDEMNQQAAIAFAQAIEAKLKEKNT